jgi:hypothetical protein
MRVTSRVVVSGVKDVSGSLVENRQLHSTNAGRFVCDHCPTLAALQAPTMHHLTVQTEKEYGSRRR